MNGFFNIDKEEGVPSTRAVNVLKHLTHTPCGHMGTLDPLASGVLPVAVGNAARLFDYFSGKKKTYRARFCFGATTDTLDREGILERGGKVPSAEEIRAALSRFTGEIEQVPPRYSACSVNGVKGYRLARRGESFELASRRVRVYSFSLLRQTAPDEFSFEIVCGGGTYIRALSRDLALALGTLGYTSALRRTASGVFTEENAVPLGALGDGWERFLIPTETVLPFPALRVDDSRYFNGVRYAADLPDGTYKVYRGDMFYGTGIVEGGVLRADKKLC